MIHFGARIFPSQCQLEGPYSLHVSNLHREIPKRVSSTQDVPARVPSVKQDSFYKICILFQSINCARFETMPGFSPRLTVLPRPHTPPFIRAPWAGLTRHCTLRVSTRHVSVRGKKVGKVGSTFPGHLSQHLHVEWVLCSACLKTDNNQYLQERIKGKTLHRFLVIIISAANKIDPPILGSYPAFLIESNIAWYDTSVSFG